MARVIKFLITPLVFIGMIFGLFIWVPICYGIEDAKMRYDLLWYSQYKDSEEEDGES